MVAANEYRQFRVIGPPGAGKTSYLSQQVARACETYGADRVVVVSLTNASAARVVEKTGLDRIAIPEKNITTLHSLANRAIGTGKDKIADLKLSEWNDWVTAAGKSHLRLSATDREDEVGSSRRRGNSSPGDEFFDQVNIARARMLPRDQWSEYARDFDEFWRLFKSELGYVDFTDMLEIALKDVDVCPGDPAAIFVDEAQDLSRLGWALVRKWGEKCIRFVTVGDPWQLLFGWAGSDVDAFYDPPLPESQIRLLGQSWRVPRAVLGEARQWIDRTPGRCPETYLPTTTEGAVNRISAHRRYPDSLLPVVEELIGRGKTVALITSAAYLLNNIASTLKDRGIPFGNPYSPDRGDFNPLHRPGGRTAADRLLSFVRCSEDVWPWTWWDLHAWCEWLDKGVLLRGAKARIERMAEAEPGGSIAAQVDDIINDSELLSLMPRDAWLKAISGDVEWFVTSLPPAKRDGFRYPMRILNAGGADALEKPPRVYLSTIHRIKGGECDAAIVLPDLSPAQYDQWGMPDGSPAKEELRRAFYVAMTRPRESLYLCAPSSGMAVTF